MVEKRWVNRNVDLELLSGSIADFLAKKGLRSRVGKQDREYRILALPPFHHPIVEEVIVVIEGDQNDFVVKFVSGKRSHLFVMYGFLTTIFGGGSFLSRGLKSEEEIESLENQFWAFAEMIIDHLSV